MIKRIYETTIGKSKTLRAFIFDNYGENLTHYLTMAAEAKKDFPKLSDEEIAVGKVRNSGYMNGYALISFTVENKHSDYKLLDKQDFNW